MKNNSLLCSLVKNFCCTAISCIRMLNPVTIRNRTALSENYFSNFSRKNMYEKKDVIISNDLVKSPNIVVYGTESQSHLKDCVKNIEHCLAVSCYTVYPISSVKFFTEPWLENTKALVILNSPFQQTDVFSIQNIVQKYLTVGGKVLSFSRLISNVKTVQNSLIQIEKFTGNLSLALQTTPNNAMVDMTVSVHGWQESAIDCNVDGNCLVKLNNSSHNNCIACFSNNENNSIVTLVSKSVLVSTCK